MNHPYLARIPDPPEWTARAECRHHRGDAWFPAADEPHVAARAVAVCLGCPVRAECLDHALAAGERHGIWGGRDLTAKRRATTA